MRGKSVDLPKTDTKRGGLRPRVRDRRRRKDPRRQVRDLPRIRVAEPVATLTNHLQTNLSVLVRSLTASFIVNLLINPMKESYYIVALPGDGIGPEVFIVCALNVLKTAGHMFQIDFQIEEIPCGGHYYAEHEMEWPEGSFEKCEQADAILLGAVGHEVDGKTVFTKPGKPYPEPQLAGFAQVILNRQKLNLYANVRPVKLYPGVKHKIHGELKQVWEPRQSRLRSHPREYRGRLHGRDERRLTTAKSRPSGSPGQPLSASCVMRSTWRAAATRQHKVTCVDKSNIIGAHRFFREVFREVGQSEFPDLKLDYAYVDAFCQWQIRNPEWYDVVVGPNLVGDIISDNGATTAGGLGLAVGGNIGDEHGMFEPIHGSAPKHAGKDRANPLAAILAAQMMLDWLGNASRRRAFATGCRDGRGCGGRAFKRRPDAYLRLDR